MDLSPSADLVEPHLRHACELARQGLGQVEPNPMVGCVILQDQLVVARGWHRCFGGPHAEIEALHQLQAHHQGAVSGRTCTMYITLEPCCHHGKTPPCTDAIIASSVQHVIVGTTDPNPQVAGDGIRQLRAAGIRVDLVEHPLCQQLIAPFRKFVVQQQPWIIGKWAMTCDGKIATMTGDSHWISSAAARNRVHQLRSRVDVVLVGIGTALSDDPQLTARNVASPPARIATRVVLDSDARLPLTSRLVLTAREIPLLVVTGPTADRARVAQLQRAGVDIYTCSRNDREERIVEWLGEFRRRQFTNVLIEGGGEVLGSMLAAKQLDEVHAFIGPKLVGGSPWTPTSGSGIPRMDLATEFESWEVEIVDRDIYLRGRLVR